MTQRLPEFLRFCLVGLVAFVIDTGLLFVLVAAGISDSSGRIVSIAVAMQVAYVLNCRFTFRGEHRGIGLATWLAFISSNIFGAVINYVVFVAAMTLAAADDPRWSRLIAVAMGTGVGLLFNYWANRRFAFREKKP